MSTTSTPDARIARAMKMDRDARREQARKVREAHAARKAAAR